MDTAFEISKKFNCLQSEMHYLTVFKLMSLQMRRVISWALVHIFQTDGLLKEMSLPVSLKTMKPLNSFGIKLSIKGRIIGVMFKCHSTDWYLGCSCIFFITDYLIDIIITKQSCLQLKVKR